MKITSEYLIEQRNKKYATIRDCTRKYRELFLNCELSEAVKQCFYDAEYRSVNKENLKSFRKYINELDRLGVLSLDNSVESLRYDSPYLVKRLLEDNSLSDMQKKLRMHALIFLFRHLEKETEGLIRSLQMPSEFKNLPSSSEKSKKFASSGEVNQILSEAHTINARDCLILKLIFYTEKSLQDILSLNCDSLNYEGRLIGGVNSIIDEVVMTQLKEYVKSTNKMRGNHSNVFISNQGKPLNRTQVQKTLDKANKATELPYRITTKMIQRSRQSERISRET